MTAIERVETGRWERASFDRIVDGYGLDAQEPA